MTHSFDEVIHKTDGRGSKVVLSVLSDEDDFPTKQKAYTHPNQSKDDHVYRHGMREKDEYYDIFWLVKVE